MASVEDIKKVLTDEFMADERTQSLYQTDGSTKFEERFKNKSIENLIFYVVAYFCWIRETMREKWLEDVEKTALATRYGTKQWWHKTAMEWQKGDAVTTLSDGSVGYSNIDESKRIVKYAAIVTEGRTVYIKVAKESGGSLTTLTASELTSFKAYIDQVKPVGIAVTTQSKKGCLIQVNGNIYYNGERTPDEVLESVKTAIQEYLKNIEFGGVLFKNKLIDAAQSVEGVTDVDIQVRVYEYDNSSFWLGRCYTAKGGYYNTSAWGLNMQEETNNN